MHPLPALPVAVDTDKLLAVVTMVHPEEGKLSLAVQLVAWTVAEETAEVVVMDVVEQKVQDSRWTEVDLLHQHMQVVSCLESHACPCFHP